MRGNDVVLTHDEKLNTVLLTQSDLAFRARNGVNPDLMKYE